ncbi:MAG TPA: hypothetical protein VFG31_05370 [Conexibacter sp.]|nr:hypothetical protein [Conexibacter sp.]
MSVQSGSSPSYQAGDSVRAASTARPDDATGYGWVVFAGTMLMLVGILNVIYGIAAIDNSTFFVNDAKYVISDLNTWGWVVLITGALQILTAFGVWARNTLATWAGIAFACFNGIGVLLMLPAYPLLSLSLFAVDVLIVYGLAVHGGHAREEI